MKAYLIDFENVKSKGLTGIELLSPEDKVIIFYSENSDTISFEMHRKVMTSTADIEYLKVRVGGKNALDFQLSTLLGYLLAKELYTHIMIISGDKGFDKLHDFWNVSFADKNSCVVFRTQTIAQAVSFSNANKGKALPEPANEEPEEEILPEIPDIPEVTEEFSAIPDSFLRDVSVMPDMEREVVELPELSEPSADKQKPRKAAAPKVKENISITKTPAKKTGKRSQSPEQLIRSALLGFVELSDSETAAVVSCAVESDDKEDFHNALAKIFKNQATELYKVLRPKYLKIKEAIGEQNDQPEQTEAVPEPAPETVQETVTAPEPEKTEPKPEKKPAQTKKRSAPKKSGKNKLASAIEKILKDSCTPEEIKTVSKLFGETDTKQKFYLSIVKEYRKDRGCEIYKLLKSDYAELEKLKTPEKQEA